MHDLDHLTRPIVGLSRCSPNEVFNIMCDRIRGYFANQEKIAAGAPIQGDPTHADVKDEELEQALTDLATSRKIALSEAKRRRHAEELLLEAKQALETFAHLPLPQIKTEAKAATYVIPHDCIRAAREVHRKIVTADLDPAGIIAVRVKPLEWQTCQFNQEACFATTVIGEYRIIQVGTSQWLIRFNDRDVMTIHTSEHDAKTAAQEIHDARVMSLIDLSVGKAAKSPDAHTQQQLDVDHALYGECFWTLKRDGTKVRIDPRSVLAIDDDGRRYVIIDARPAVRVAGAVRALKRLKEDLRMGGKQAAAIERVIQTLRTLSPDHDPDADLKFERDVAFHIAQLRNAYVNLCGTAVCAPQKVAEEFIVPVLDWLEGLANGGTAEGRGDR